MFCERGVETTALLLNEYTETTAGKVIKMVTYKYNYIVNEQTYTGEITTNTLPENNEIKVTYLPDKPELSERGDPCKTYENIKSNNTSPFLMYLGIGTFFIGLIVAWKGLKNLIQKK